MGAVNKFISIKKKTLNKETVLLLTVKNKDDDRDIFENIEVEPGRASFRVSKKTAKLLAKELLKLTK